MKTLLTIKGLALAWLVLAGMQAMASTNDIAAGAKSLKVVVLAGHEIELARVGAMVFWNKRSTLPAKDATVTDAVFQAIKAEFELEQRQTVDRLAVPAEALPRLARLASEGANAFFGPSLEPIQAEVAEYRAGCQCDALLLVAASRGQLNPNSNQSFNGFSWVGMSGLNEEVRRAMSVSYLTFFLVDAATGKTIPYRTGNADGGLALIPADRWPNDMADLSDEQWNTLSQGFASGLRRQVRKPLYRLGLRPSCSRYFWDIDHPAGSGTFNAHDRLTQEGPPAMPEGADPAKCSN